MHVAAAARVREERGKATIAACRLKRADHSSTALADPGTARSLHARMVLGT